MPKSRLALRGCNPAPLASYLKALGVLRLLSSGGNNVTGQAADADARCWWDEERLHLQTTLGRQGIVDFFLRGYAPSPIIAPWNGRAGFLEGERRRGEGAELMRKIEKSSSRRFEPMRSAIRLLRTNDDLVRFDELRTQAKRLQRAKGRSGDAERDRKEKLRRVNARAKSLKANLLPSLRSEIADAHVRYMDSCFAIAAEGDSKASPLLIAGGLDGSRDFGVRFAAALENTFSLETGEPFQDGERLLQAALFDTPVRLNDMGSIGMFNQGPVGPNSTVGYRVMDSPINYWDVVLMMEGTIVFGGALTRRWGSKSKNRSHASFPFTFETTQAGAGGFSSDDPHPPRGEIWTPLWSKPARYAELRAVFAEGRLTVGGSLAYNGLDAARAVAQMGASRGIDSFERYSLVQPGSSLPHQATPIGRVHSPKTARPDLIADLELGGWLESARRVARTATFPARAKAALHALENALFSMTDNLRAASGTLDAIISLGNFVEWLAVAPSAREQLPPPPLLSRAWLRQSYDGSPEFRVAAALAGLGIPSASREGRADRAGKLNSNHPPMAAHHGPLTKSPSEGFERRTFLRGGWLKRRRAWADGNRPPTFVWGQGTLAANMIAVLERRLVEAPIRGLADKPLASASSARLSDVAAFLDGDFDDARCTALLKGMVWAQPAWLPRRHESLRRSSPPFAFAALKPLFSTDRSLKRAGAIPKDGSVLIPPGLINRLRADHRSRSGRAINQSVRTALLRARSSGLPSPFYDSILSRGGASTLRSGRMGVGVQPARLAAAMLIPISLGGLKALIQRAYPGASPTPPHLSEETPSAD